jgi:hypothetical protein
VHINSIQINFIIVSQEIVQSVRTTPNEVEVTNSNSSLSLVWTCQKKNQFYYKINILKNNFHISNYYSNNNSKIERPRVLFPQEKTIQLKKKKKTRRK